MKTFLAFTIALALSVQGWSQGNFFSGLPVLSDPQANADFALILDVSDTSIAPTGRGKKIRLDSLSAILTPTWANLAGKPTTLVGFGITDAQPLDPDLTVWAGVTSSANGRSLVSAANYAAMRALLDLEPGIDFLGYPTGAPNGTKFLRDDNSWQVITGGGDALVANPLSQFAATTSAQLAGVLSNETGTAGFAVFSVSPALTGSPTAPTQTAGDNSTKIATTAYVDGASVSVTDPGANVVLQWNDATNTIETAGFAASAVATLTGSQTLTNKRITTRLTTIASSATPTVNTDNCDCVTITALAAAITSMTTNLSGTPVNFDQLEYRIKDDGTARAITWGASFAAGPVALPTTTVVNKPLHVWLEYDSVQAKWVCVGAGSDS